jgi:hypothetical protein
MIRSNYARFDSSLVDRQPTQPNLLDRDRLAMSTFDYLTQSIDRPFYFLDALTKNEELESEA